MLAAQNKESRRVAPEPGTQGGRLTADFTVARRATPLEPQVRLAIELVLQVMSRRFRRRVVAGARKRAVADASRALPLDHDGVPLAGIGTDFALARGEHVFAFRLLELSADARLTLQVPGWPLQDAAGQRKRQPAPFRFCDAPGVAIGEKSAP